MNDDQLRSAFGDLLQDLPDDQALPAATASRVRRRRQLKVGAGVLGGAAALVTAAVLVLGSTSPDDDRLEEAERPTPTPTASPSTAPSRPLPSPPSPSPSATATEVQVVLRPDGLGLTDGGSSTTTLAFGSDAAAVRAALDAALGQGGERPTPDCGEGSSTVQYESIFLLLQNDAFVGWVTGSPGPTTGDGIGIGSTEAELRASYPDLQITESTLGVEWATAGDGGLAGFLDRTAEGGVVSSVRGGVSCLAR